MIKLEILFRFHNPLSRISESTSQQVNKSTSQQVNESIGQRVDRSEFRNIDNSKSRYFNHSPHSLTCRPVDFKVNLWGVLLIY